MLPAPHRLTDGETFRHVARRGRRAGSRTLVVHLAVTGGSAPARAGFVVSRAVGNAVVRNRVKRRLRHLVSEHLAALDGLPGSAVVVVRAQPAAATASYSELRRDLARCLSKTVDQPTAPRVTA